MAKKMIISIAYQRFALQPADALMLIDIGARMVRVEREAYDKPYHPHAEQAPLMDSAEMAEFDDNPLPAEAESTAHREPKSSLDDGSPF